MMGVKMERVRDVRKKRRTIVTEQKGRDWRTKWQRQKKKRIGEGGRGGM